jgi:ribosomal 50S subunit-recycling heat shock protein
MRVDLALKYLCLAKSRSSVKTLCDKQALLVNGRPTKASANLHANDRVTIDRGDRTLSVTIVEVPEKQLSKAKAREYYRVVHD